MTPLDFLIFSLATWRLANLFVNEEGPFHIFGRLRDLSGITHDLDEIHVPDNLLAGILSCVWCCSIWAGGFFILFWFFLPKIAFLVAAWLAFSALAILFNKLMESK